MHLPFPWILMSSKFSMNMYDIVSEAIQSKINMQTQKLHCGYQWGLSVIQVIYYLTVVVQSNQTCFSLPSFIHSFTDEL